MANHSEWAWPGHMNLNDLEGAVYVRLITVFKHYTYFYLIVYIWLF